MPNWENEIKKAIYEESLEGEEKNNFLLIMNLLKGGTPQEYITGIDAKIKKAEQEKAVIESRINVAQEKINFEYGAKEDKINIAYVEEVEKIDHVAPRLANAMDSMAKIKKGWNDMVKTGRAKGLKTKDFDETFDAIMKEVDEKPNTTYDKTDAYQNLYGGEKELIESYLNQKIIYDSIPSKEKMLPLINQAKENRINAIQALGEKPTVQSDLLDKQKSLGEDIKIFEDNKKTMEDFEKNQYKQMQNVKINNLSPAAKEAGLDLLTQARIDYQTKLNGFERLLANILPTWMYPNGKYVDKINSYKKSLKEVGFSDDEIKKAAPDKDANYIYNEEEKRYEKPRDLLDFENVDEELVHENKVTKYDEPEKQQEVRQQPKEFMENLADQTVDNKGSIVKPKDEIKNDVPVKKGPQIGGNNQ